MRQQITIDPSQIRVIDGDTFAYLGQRYRLTGFDSAEIFHPRHRVELRHGLSDRDRLARRVATAKTAKLISYDSDRYGRTLASLRLDGEDVASFMRQATGEI